MSPSAMTTMAVGAPVSRKAKSSLLRKVSGNSAAKWDRKVPSSKTAKGALGVLPEAKYVGSKSTMPNDTLTGAR